MFQFVVGLIGMAICIYALIKVLTHAEKNIESGVRFNVAVYAMALPILIIMGMVLEFVMLYPALKSTWDGVLFR